MNTRILLEEHALRKSQHRTWSWVEGESHGRPARERLHCVEAKLDDVGARSPEGTGGGNTRGERASTAGSNHTGVKTAQCSMTC